LPGGDAPFRAMTDLTFMLIMRNRYYVCLWRLRAESRAYRISTRR